MNTYEKTHFNPPAINTYKNAGLKVEQNQHLQKNRGVGVLSVVSSVRGAHAVSTSPLPPRAEVPGKGSFGGKQVGGI